MNRRFAIVVCLALLLTVGAARAEEKRPLRVVPQVDLARYAGQWYEIARLPNRFQKRCSGEVTAKYTLQPDGRISVLNRCRLEDGGQIEAEGVARIADKAKAEFDSEGSFRSGIPFLPSAGVGRLPDHRARSGLHARAGR